MRGKITYWLGTGKVGMGMMPAEFCRSSTKPEAMKAAKAFMENNPPQSEYDTVQIVPYTADGRKWGTPSVRWYAGRNTWKKGEGIS